MTTPSPEHLSQTCRGVKGRARGETDEDTSFPVVGQGGQAQGAPCRPSVSPACPQARPSEQPRWTHLAQIRVTGDTSRKSGQLWAGSHSPGIQGGCSFVCPGAWASPRATRVLAGQSSCRVGVPLPTPRKQGWPSPPCPHPHPCLLGAPGGSEIQRSSQQGCPPPTSDQQRPGPCRAAGHHLTPSAEAGCRPCSDPALPTAWLLLQRRSRRRGGAGRSPAAFPQ